MRTGSLVQRAVQRPLHPVPIVRMQLLHQAVNGAVWRDVVATGQGGHIVRVADGAGGDIHSQVTMRRHPGPSAGALSLLLTAKVLGWRPVHLPADGRVFMRRICLTMAQAGV